ncbi:helix-turn-helix transcriptional regulator [Streptomyces sp. H10-C2]|uniref:helix-turn-helix domain-containing protein n=1 Tax=unclassified Streptomyces TaxID=2593676 RepID=UPI0024B8B3A7|nr:MULTISPECIES: helix-turn-helix transcriptional regulator [unclassified Streptomyces]MDJ0342179.1 helix-turn-helix transcriptional regulator [Streptomyces sp. PH10-H1]MDJ0368693.1 helix-turn-helix transcriptional regulator [Streptomyces sp. H10-C2]
MSHDWAQMAAAVKQAREDRGLTQMQLAELLGVSESTIQNIEDAKRVWSRRPPTYGLIEREFWTPGSVAAVLAGGKPTPKPDDSASVSDDAKAPVRPQLPLRVQHELDREVVDTEIIELRRGGMKMVVVLTRDAAIQAGEDELIEDFAEWSRVQREIRGIVAQVPNGEPTST